MPGDAAGPAERREGGRRGGRRPPDRWRPRGSCAPGTTGTWIETAAGPPRRARPGSRLDDGCQTVLPFRFGIVAEDSTVLPEALDPTPAPTAALPGRKGPGAGPGEPDEDAAIHRAAHATRGPRPRIPAVDRGRSIADVVQQSAIEDLSAIVDQVRRLATTTERIEPRGTAAGRHGRRGTDRRFPRDLPAAGRACTSRRTLRTVGACPRPRSPISTVIWW